MAHRRCDNKAVRCRVGIDWCSAIFECFSTGARSIRPCCATGRAPEPGGGIEGMSKRRRESCGDWGRRRRGWRDAKDVPGTHIGLVQLLQIQSKHRVEQIHLTHMFQQAEHTCMRASRASPSHAGQARARGVADAGGRIAAARRSHTPLSGPHLLRVSADHDASIHILPAAPLPATSRRSS